MRGDRLLLGLAILPARFVIHVLDCCQMQLPGSSCILASRSRMPRHGQTNKLLPKTDLAWRAAPLLRSLYEVSSLLGSTGLMVWSRGLLFDQDQVEWHSCVASTAVAEYTVT